MVKVLLTGASGFIATHILNILLARGFDTVITVRSTEKGQKIIDSHPDKRLSFVIVEDIAKEGAFDETFKSNPPFDYVVHTASPFHFNIRDPVKDLLDPAIKGTTGMLRAVKAYAPTVKRVVITSSFAAIMAPTMPPEVYDETSWNPVTLEEAYDPSQPATTYRASKTFAEKAAWRFVKQEKPNFDVTTINPPLVFGPTTHLNSLDAINTSNARIRDLIEGAYKEGIAPTGNVYLWVDVRDVALAHVRAIEVPEAGGQRFLVTAGHFANSDLVKLVRELHPELEANLPPKEASSDLPSDIYGYDNNKSVTVLGIKYRSLKESVADTVKSLLAIGA